MPSSRVRPLWGRICAAAAALLVTLVAVLGAIGLTPAAPSAAAAAPTAALVTQSLLPAPTASVPVDGFRSNVPLRRTSPSSELGVPAGSGTGKRVVFDITDQRVWLVNADGTAGRTYLVSGSLTDNLHPGSYSVYSTSRWATGVDESGIMQYFVRFTHGARAAIGFHSIPTKDGQPVQSTTELGTAQSHGCIRQWLPDAKALWDFAPVGTKVVVLA